MCAWTREDVPPLDGAAAVVTGANSGIGYAATEALADREPTVVMACRSEQCGADAATEIRASVAEASLDVRRCDLADLSDVEQFAEGGRRDYDGVDLLANNAGIRPSPEARRPTVSRNSSGQPPGSLRADGHLLPSLRGADGEARVVIQSSGVHERGDVDFEDLQGEDDCDAWDAYAQSKLANVCFAYELDRHLDAAGVADVTNVACHPVTPRPNSSTGDRDGWARGSGWRSCAS